MDRQALVETHPLEPFFPEHARLLMLGSFPPKRERWRMDFYYPNFQNDMWRIFGLVFFRDKDYFLAEQGNAFREGAIRSFLAEKGIALSDAGQRVVRLKDNASDKYLEIVEPIDLHWALDCLPCCEAVVTTGQKATDTLLGLVGAVFSGCLPLRGLIRSRWRTRQPLTAACSPLWGCCDSCQKGRSSASGRGGMSSTRYSGTGMLSGACCWSFSMRQPSRFVK